MSTGGVPERPHLSAIADADVAEVSRFLHANLNDRVSPQEWAALLDAKWASSPQTPNHGFRLTLGRETVGVYVAVYSDRALGDRIVSICNLAAFCVLPEHRAHSLRLVRAVLGQKGYFFTDFSPSGNVPAMNDRLGFTRLDTSTRVVVNLPSARKNGWAITDDHDEIAKALSAEDFRIYNDHRTAPAARHLLVRRDADYAYVIYRRDRRKRMAAFASPLHVLGKPGVLEDAWAQVCWFLLRRGFLMTLAESRVLRFSPAGPGRELKRPRPKMYKGDGLRESEIDYLYSELTLLEW